MKAILLNKIAIITTNVSITCGSANILLPKWMNKQSGTIFYTNKAET
jgi:hypothetical protein